MSSDSKAFLSLCLCAVVTGLLVAGAIGTTPAFRGIFAGFAVFHGLQAVLYALAGNQR